MGRHKDELTPTEMRECDIHGLVEFRRHKKGLAKGRQKYRWRCPLCHTEKNR